MFIYDNPWHHTATFSGQKYRPRPNTVDNKDDRDGDGDGEASQQTQPAANHSLTPLPPNSENHICLQAQIPGHVDEWPPEYTNTALGLWRGLAWDSVGPRHTRVLLPDNVALPQSPYCEGLPLKESRWKLLQRQKGFSWIYIERVKFLGVRRRGGWGWRREWQKTPRSKQDRDR